MAHKFRQIVAKEIFSLLKLGLADLVASEGEKQLAKCVRICAPSKDGKAVRLQVHKKELYKCLPTLQSLAPLDEWTFHQYSNDNWLQSIGKTKEHSFDFYGKPQPFLKEVLEETHLQGELYGTLSDVHDEAKLKYIVEFSSPNIAKPFHAGHIRSTVIGNFISNLLRALRHHVVRINYLGDWGTQFGLLSLGYQLYGDERKLEADPIHHLFDVYVNINTDAENDSEILRKGKEAFCNLEHGDVGITALWHKFRLLSIHEYEKTYHRLGVRFDEYEGESMYRDAAGKLIKDLEAIQLAKRTDDGAVHIPLSGSTSNCILAKSDGTTVYLSRDIAAVVERIKKHNFNKMIYVVENAQHQHFNDLFAILEKMECLDDRELVHVKFGRVQNMSTRKGNVILLEDILDEAKNRMLEKMKHTETTKVTEDFDNVAEILGVSAIIVQDLKDRRTKNYNFVWDKMLASKGDTGVFMQYTYARLCSIERNCGVTADVDTTEHLVEPEALRLTQQIARFDEVLRQAQEELEPCILVHYLFQLCHLSNLANHSLRVKGEESSLASARLLLFRCARITLGNGLKILGLIPLERM